MAPRGLAPPLQSLPAILHMKVQNPISGYSKGARGLSVQSRVTGIFTGATVSPSSCRRQQSSRYTIRAGRNLPDKEFRSSSPHVAMWLGPYLRLETAEVAGVWPLRIPNAWLQHSAFPADCPHRSHFHSDRQTRVAPDSRVFQHMASFAPRNCSRGGQSPGKRAWVVTLGPL